MPMKTDVFEPILLEQMDQVKLMNRTDTKYWFHVDKLQDLLNDVKDDYYLLHINQQGLLPYTSTYYDTDRDHMFTAHQNGKLNRFKIRRRTYLTSDKSFMEIKFKSNKGRTMKHRIETSAQPHITTTEDTFIKESSPFNGNDLRPVLINKFNRLMLVSKAFDERCTIDVDLEFDNLDKSISLDNLTIVEIKAEGFSKTSPLMKALAKRHIKSSGFSKYCVGRTISDHHLKRNNFKRKIRQIENILNCPNKLYHRVL